MSRITFRSVSPSQLPAVLRGVCFGVALVLLPPAVASAQISRLDPGQFIEGLRKENLRVLLRHLVESEPMEDPILKQQVLINTLRLDYQDALAIGDGQKAGEFFRQALDELRKLINNHYDNEQRPVWQTQLGEMLLFEFLEALNTNASQFYEFGVPTAKQREVFESVVAEAVENLEDAEVRFSQLQTELPKEPDHTQKRVNTGLWARMMEEYYKTRTRYCLAHALYFTYLVPTSHPYYQKLGENPKIVRQKKDVVSERSRLLSFGVQQLDDLIADPNDSWSIRSRCQCLWGRIKTAAAQYDPAIEMLDKVLKLQEGEMNSLLAGMGKAMALAGKGRTPPAMDALSGLSSHPLVASNLLLRVLVTDAEHRVLMAAAEKTAADQKARAIADAYEPYLKMLQDPSLGEKREPLRNYVYQRWMDVAGENADLSKHPPVVVGAIIETLRAHGQNGAIEAAQTGDSDAAAEAVKKLNRSIAAAQALVKRADASDAVKAQAMLNQGLATYFLDTSSRDRTVEAAKILTAAADQWPTQPVAEQAIGYAVEMLHQLHAGRLAAAGRDEAYRQCLDVLLSKFPTTQAADNERFYYAFSFLIPAKDHPKAVEVLSKVPFGHPTYFEAQRERLYAMFELAKQDAPQWTAKLQEDAETVRQQAEREMLTADPEQLPAVRNAAGHARIILADLAERSGDIDKALQHLRGFEDDFLGDNELLRLGLGRRILLLARAGKLDEASVEATRMMKAFPDDAAPVVDRVLTDLDTAASEAREQAAKELAQRPRDALLTRAKGLSETAAKLAELLVNWASAQGLPPEQMVPFRLILAKSMRTSGNAPGAMAMVKPLHDQFPQDADVLQELGEALFAVGGRENLLEAAELYKTLIGGLPPDDQGRYPTAYWNAWMRYCQVCEKLDENTNIITLRVRGLQQSDENLGGEPYKSELIRLMNKYSQ